MLDDARPVRMVDKLVLTASTDFPMRSSASAEMAVTDTSVDMDTAHGNGRLAGARCGKKAWTAETRKSRLW